MESYEVSGEDQRRIERLAAEVGIAARQSGGIGLPPDQVEATLKGLLFLMSVKPSDIAPRANWDNHAGRSRPVSDLAVVIRHEIPADISAVAIERIISRIQQAGIRTIGQLVSRSRWDAEHGQIHLGRFDLRILEVALALRKLRFGSTSGQD